MSKARAETEKIVAVSHELSSPHKDEEHRRQTFERLCAANVRRATALRHRLHKLPEACLLVIPFPRGSTTPRPALLKRIATVTHRLAATAAARQAAATARRAAKLAMLR